ncbi:ATP-binding protein [candidate division LCP-89 bacterium B3_LCP]|uniref:ATP-binding protein n=1 Tax=candidate division LCP-89 bacterium B3_LCP TaxID=2012998 RepID=A0A532UN12_UNCL8|nr:MAG: ATP-binding protein [candidate division LCP-89 bacterium B3_LCP]
MSDITEHLTYLKLAYIRENYEAVGKTAARKQWDHIQYLSELVRQESNLRKDRSIQRRIRLAKFPVIKTLDQFDWPWPKKINQAQVKNLFRLKFIEEKSNVVFIGSVGVGKTHIATALGYQACLKNNTVLFASAIDAVNNLIAAQHAGQLKQELKKYLKPSLLVLDELGYLPIDKNGADLLFQIISERYERGSIIITTNRVFKDWPQIFNNDSTLTSALLDRLLHHTEAVVIEGNSYRMRKIKE